MRIARRHLINAQFNRLYTSLAITASMFVFAYSTSFGKIAILVLYSFWLPLILVDYRRVIGPARRLFLPALFCTFALSSVFWSAAPSTSLRGAIQYATQILCALIAARTCDLKSLTWGIVVGGAIVILYSVAFGRYAFDTLDGSYTFVGAFASKNQLGFFSSLCLYFTLIGLFALRVNWIGIAVLAASGLLATATLLASHSATSIISVILATLTLVVFLLSLRFRPSLRTGLLLLLAPLTSIAIVAALQMGGASALLGAFGKDATLTGRTYLWSIGMQSIWNHPILGVGYQAYWVEGFAEAERLWAEFFITARTGFHFHNTLIETSVELGILGLAMLICIYVAIIAHLVRRVIRQEDREAAAFLGLMVMMLVRAFVEVDTLNPYTIGSFLIFFLYFSRREYADKGQ